MFARIDRRLGLAIVLLSTTVVAASASPASAQEWLADRSRAEGRGIRLGDFELHPGFGLEVGYDSNVFYADGSAANPTEGSAMLRASAHLFMSTLGQERMNAGGTQARRPPRVAFRGGVSASYYHFFLDRARDNVEGDLGLSLTINPERPVSVTLFDNFGRTIRPFTQQLGGSSTSFARDQNEAGAKVAFGTSGGVFGGSVGYSFGIDYFEGDAFAFARSLTHTIDGAANWRFLPRTAIVYDVRVQLQNYTDAGAGSGTLVTNNTRVRSRIGLNGAFTQRFSLSAMVGYSAGFYSDARGDEYESVSGQLEARWTPSQTVRFSLGYDREFFPSFVGNFARRDQLYADLQVLLGGSFMLGAKIAGGLYGFGNLIDASGMPLGSTLDRNDVRFSFSLFGEYRVKDWLGFNVSLGYTGQFTDYEYRTATMMGTLIDPAGFNKFEAWGGVRIFL